MMQHSATFDEITLAPPSEEGTYTQKHPASLTIFSDPGRHTALLELEFYGSADDFENLSDWARDCARARRR